VEEGACRVSESANVTEVDPGQVLGGHESENVNGNVVGHLFVGRPYAGRRGAGPDPCPYCCRVPHGRGHGRRGACYRLAFGSAWSATATEVNGGKVSPSCLHCRATVNDLGGPCCTLYVDSHNVE
jgi:hypothetical protein